MNTENKINITNILERLDDNNLYLWIGILKYSENANMIDALVRGEEIEAVDWIYDSKI